MRGNFIVLVFLALGGLLVVIGCSTTGEKQSSVIEISETGSAIDQSVSKIEPEVRALDVYRYYRQLKLLTKGMGFGVRPTSSGSGIIGPPDYRTGKDAKEVVNEVVENLGGLLVKPAANTYEEWGMITSDPHINRGLKNYANTIADKAFTQRQKTFPEGAIIVQEMLDVGEIQEIMKGKILRSGDSGIVVFGVGGMIKRAPGYDAENGDWEYFYYNEAVGFSTGRINNCAKCHARAKSTNYVFSVGHSATL